MKLMDEMIGKYVIIRSIHAGVFTGILAEKEGDEVVLTDCRRIWYWEGAASLSQLAVDGISKSTVKNCRFTKTVDSIGILGVIEIIPTTKKAEKSIRGIPVWAV